LTYVNAARRAPMHTIHLLPVNGGNSMVKNPLGRKLLSVVLVIAGAVLIFLAPDHIWVGGVMAALGVGIEFIRIVVDEHRKK